MSEYARRSHNATEQKLNNELRKPERVEQERQFAREHQNDTDEELIEYVVKLKLEQGKIFNHRNVIGYLYIVKRFKAWNVFMHSVNQRIKEIKENPEQQKNVSSKTGKKHSKNYNANLELALSDPERMAQEAQFARDHANDSDSDLIKLLKQAKLSTEGKLHARDFIGICHIEKRFGSWNHAMNEVNRELLADKRMAKQQMKRGQTRLIP